MDPIGKLVFMTAGISDPKQSQAGGLSKDLGGGVGRAGVGEEG